MKEPRAFSGMTPAYHKRLYESLASVIDMDLYRKLVTCPNCNPPQKTARGKRHK